MGNTKLFTGGVPTDIEVKQLREKWPESEMQAGDTFSCDEISRMLGISGNRFRSVTLHWRNLVERETGKRIVADGTGSFFRVASDAEKLELIKDKRHSLNRQTRKNYVRVGYVDRKNLSDDQRATLDFFAQNEKKILSVSQLRGQIALPE